MKISLHQVVLWLVLGVLASSADAQKSSENPVQPQATGYLNVTFSQGFKLLSNPLLESDNSIQSLLAQPPEGTVLLKWGTSSGSAILPDPQASQVAQWLNQFPGNSTGTTGAIQVLVTNRTLKLTWSGTLQTATNVTGPYTNVVATNQMLTVTNLTGRRFWRVKGATNLPPGGGGLSLKQFTVALFQNGAWSNPGLTLSPGEGAVLFNPSTNSYNATFVGGVPEGTLTNSIPAGLSLISALAPISGGITSNLHLQPNPGDQVILWTGKQFQAFAFQTDQSWSPSEPKIDVAGAFFIRASKPILWVITITPNPRGQ